MEADDMSDSTSNTDYLRGWKTSCTFTELSAIYDKKLPAWLYFSLFPIKGLHIALIPQFDTKGIRSFRDLNAAKVQAI